MFEVTLYAYSVGEPHQARPKHRRWQSEELTDALANCLASMDAVVVETIDCSGPQLGSVHLSVRIVPMVSKKDLARCWIDAVSRVAGIVEIIGDIPTDRTPGTGRTPELPESEVERRKQIHQTLLAARSLKKGRTADGR